MEYNHDNYLKNTYIKEDLNTYDFVFANYLYERFLKPANLTSGKILDIGCGRGHQLLAFSRWYVAHGIDQSLIAKDLFNKRNVSIDLQWANLESEKLPYPDNHFEVIFTKSVIEHVANTPFFLSEIKRVLKSNGIAIILTPAWETQFINFYDDFTHIKPFTIHGLKGALNSVDLKRIALEEIYQLPFTWKNSYMKIIPKLISALVPNRLKWKNADRTKPNKLIRFSKETMLLAVVNK